MISDIRIVQCALRPNRLESGNPDKKAYMILPYIDYDNCNNDDKSFDEIRKIIGKKIITIYDYFPVIQSKFRNNSHCFCKGLLQNILGPIL